MLNLHYNLLYTCIITYLHSMLLAVDKESFYFVVLIVIIASLLKTEKKVY